MAVQKLSVGLQCVHGAALRRLLEELTRSRGVALAFHFPGANAQIIGTRREAPDQERKQVPLRWFS